MENLLTSSLHAGLSAAFSTYHLVFGLTQSQYIATILFSAAYIVYDAAEMERSKALIPATRRRQYDAHHLLFFVGCFIVMYDILSNGMIRSGLYARIWLAEWSTLALNFNKHCHRIGKERPPAFVAASFTLYVLTRPINMVLCLYRVATEMGIAAVFIMSGLTLLNILWTYLIYRKIVNAS